MGSFPDRDQRRANRRSSPRQAVTLGVIFALALFLAGVVGVARDVSAGQAVVTGVFVAFAVGAVSLVARRLDGRDARARGRADDRGADAGEANR